MTIAATGFIVSAFGPRKDTANMRIWDEVDGRAPAE
jgi:hypothetical protein